MATFTVPLTGTTVTPEGAGHAANGAAAAPALEHEQTPAAETKFSKRFGALNANAPAQARETVAPQQPTAREPEYQFAFNKFGKAKLVPVEARASAGDSGANAAADVESPTASAGVRQAEGFDVPPHPDAEQQEQQEKSKKGGKGKGWRKEIRAQVGALTQTVNLLAQTQMRGAQPQAIPAPQPPDPAQFDFFDAASAAEFHKLNTAYMQAHVQHAVNAALEPHRDTMESAKYTAQYQEAVAKYGKEANFQPRMDAALKLMAEFPGRLSIPEAYKAVKVSSSPQSAASKNDAKPAVRTITAEEAAQKAQQAKRLPASNGVSGDGNSLPSHIKGLGAIMAYNQQTGRARR